MSGWYYADRNRQQHGPVSSEELVTHYRYGRVALDSLVWREGLSEWLPLREFSAELGLHAAATRAGLRARQGCPARCGRNGNG